ncbi:unnamed protein product [Ixodes pacificus]
MVQITECEILEKVRYFQPGYWLTDRAAQFSQVTERAKYLRSLFCKFGMCRLPKYLAS